MGRSSDDADEAERRPHADGEQGADGLGQLDGPSLGLPVETPECEATDERRDEAVAVEADRREVARQGDREHRELPRQRRRPAAGIRRQETKAADPADHDTQDDRDGDLERGIRDPVATGSRMGGQRHGDQDERCGDTVVEAALDVEHAPDTDRDGLVGHHRLPERGVGRRQGAADEERHRQWEGRPRHRRDQGAQRDGERQPDGEEPDDHAGVLPQRIDPDERRVREQDQRQGQLGEQAHGLGAGIDIDHPEPGEQESDRHEHDGWADRATVERRRDERVATDEGGDERELEIMYIRTMFLRRIFR